MIGPRVKLVRKAESQGRYGLQYDLEFEFLPDLENSGHQAFWMDDSEALWMMPHVFLRAVNPMAVETMEAGCEYNLVFSPVDVPKVLFCSCGCELKFKPGHERGMCPGCDKFWELVDGEWRER